VLPRGQHWGEGLITPASDPVTQDSDWKERVRGPTEGCIIEVVEAKKCFPVLAFPGKAGGQRAAGRGVESYFVDWREGKETFYGAGTRPRNSKGTWNSRRVVVAEGEFLGKAGLVAAIRGGAVPHGGCGIQSFFLIGLAELRLEVGGVGYWRFSRAKRVVYIRFARADAPVDRCFRGGALAPSLGVRFLEKKKAPSNRGRYFFGTNVGGFSISVIFAWERGLGMGSDPWPWGR